MLTNPLAWVFLLLPGTFVGLGVVSILHHGGHRHFSRNDWINSLWVQVACPVGLWVGHWGLKHRVHHRFPAAYPDDPFTSASTLFRFHPSAPHKIYHRWQHYYVLLAYTTYWIIDQASQLTFLVTGSTYGRHGLRMKGRWPGYCWEKACFALTIAPYLYFFGVGFVERFFVTVTIGSLAASILVSMNHISLGARVAEQHSDWRQIVADSTVNYSIDSTMIGFLSGGLNTHSVHHLMPNETRANMRSLHRQLLETVDDECITFSSMLDAVRAHFAALKWLGKGETGSLIGGDVQHVRR
ncbi:fatty acid desaturase family protein [Micromonospora zhanjiangensis]|uniref:Fatty acid desaturase family protein n=1 Tax=Micromonospora zhanjiangensis TaxID=1522057 RepID=A0ABV8KXP8_9ACTN